MILERITNADHPMYEKARELYRVSIPYHERREEPSQERILKDDTYHFSLVYDEDSFVGIVLYWEAEDYIYIEHICIRPEMRNHQYGRKTLELIKEKNKTVILEIDPPEDEISIRRKGFYERAGFVENPYEYYQLPYHREDKECPLLIMTYPEVISRELYDDFLDNLKNRFMYRTFE